LKLDSDEGRRLADSIEARASADIYAASPQALDCRVEAIAGATLLLAPRVPVSYFNRVIGLGVFEPATETALDAIVERFRAARVADYWLHLNPVARPERLTEWLSARGFAPPARRTWAKFLRGPEPYSAQPSALSVRTAKPATLSSWFAGLVVREDWYFVIAESGGRPVATGALFIAGAMAWLGVGATLDEHRNRGAQSALLAARIAIAAEAGCTLLATETGESIAGEVNPSLNNIRRAGFVQVCSRLNYASAKS